MTMRILATRHVHASGSHAGTRLQGQELAVEKLDAKVHTFCSHLLIHTFILFTLVLDAKVHNNKGRYFENPAVDHDEAVANIRRSVDVDQAVLDQIYAQLPWW